MWPERVRGVRDAAAECVYALDERLLLSAVKNTPQSGYMAFKELLNYPILMLDRKSTTSEYLHNLFLQNQLDLVPEIELSSNDLLIDLARIGLGIAFIPVFCLSQTSDSDSLFIVETKEVLPERELVIAYNEKVPISKAAQEFLSYF